jgi:hypothetical protein
MPKFSLSYAYDVPHYADFIVEAPTKEEALRIATEALNAGKFSHVTGTECIENMNGDRVFLQEEEPLDESESGYFDPTLDELLGEDA